MRELNTIQKREKLNRVFAADETGTGNANHEYDIYPAQNFSEDTEPLLCIQFQHGARKEPDSIHGLLDTDLLEIVRDRLRGFQSGQFACRENACALTHIEEALMWMNRRVEDRIERNVLGTEKE
ncbi:MAG: ABC transporter ATPase [Ruminococcus sp.]|nr:ABC transporter ATPase [Ruminococcus sp.]